LATTRGNFPDFLRRPVSSLNCVHASRHWATVWIVATRLVYCSFNLEYFFHVATWIRLFRGAHFWITGHLL
jgi:hypothetical protein